ncbi:MAG: HAD family hydrolase, partial [Methyloceanibacter sp.]
VGGGLGKLLDRAVAAHGGTLDGVAREKGSREAVRALRGEGRRILAPLSGCGERAWRLARSWWVPLGLCTNKPEAIARDLLQALGVAGAFGCIQGGDAGLPKNPDPAGVMHVMASLGGAESARTIMVGDSVTDVKTARAGVILVFFGYTATPAHALGADGVIDHLDELPRALARFAARER